MIGLDRPTGTTAVIGLYALLELEPFEGRAMRATRSYRTRLENKISPYSPMRTSSRIARLVWIDHLVPTVALLGVIVSERLVLGPRLLVRPLERACVTATRETSERRLNS